MPRFARDFSQIPVQADARTAIQKKLQVNTPGDTHEQQADRIAEQVIRMPEPQLQRTCACGGGCPKCQNEPAAHEHLHTEGVQANDMGEMATPPIVHEVLPSSTQPLALFAREFIEPRFGHDFSRVRVDAYSEAANAARAVQARAYTIGRDIVFGSGEYAPATAEGKRLLAHELTHVVQQSSTDQAPAVQREEFTGGPGKTALDKDRPLIGYEGPMPYTALSRLGDPDDLGQGRRLARPHDHRQRQGGVQMTRALATSSRSMQERTPRAVARARGPVASTTLVSCPCGGSCPRCRENLRIQPSLELNASGDRFEQEADRIAERIVRSPQTATTRRHDVRGQAPVSSADEVERISAMGAVSGCQQGVTDAAASAEAALGSGGAPLESHTRRLMEARLGRDLGAVRIHTDSRAADSARALGAAAYTLGSRIAFAPGRFDPRTQRGERLLARELVHVVQQRGNGVSAAPGQTVQRAPDETWIAKMQALKAAALAREMTEEQEEAFVDGLNEVTRHNARSAATGIVLPVETYPGRAELEDGHVYFEKEYWETPAVTRNLCKAKASSRKAREATQCTEGLWAGNAIIIGPKVVLETEAYTRSIFDHETVHYYLAWERRNRQDGKDSGWSEAVSSSDQRQQIHNEEALAYAEQFSAIFEMSDGERYSTVTLWAQHYSYANASTREISKEIINFHLVRTYANARPDSGPLRAELFKVQECCATQECGWRCNNAEDSYAAVANAMYDMRTVLDNLEGKAE